MKFKRLGILGDGQLAKMLVEACYPLGICPVIYSDSPSTPLATLCPNIIYGNRNDTKALAKFLSQVDVVVFESEFFDQSDLEKAREVSGSDTQFLPSASTMGILRDKLHQKRLLRELKIPTSDFFALENAEDTSAWLKKVEGMFPRGFVLKWGRLGYDGRGVFFPSKKNFGPTLDFCERAKALGVSLFAEEKIKFRRELAITGCYGVTKEFVSYPLVISTQENGICVQVSGPATSMGVRKSLENKAHSFAEKLARKVELYGCFSIELFETRKGELLVNEIAPRIHNSAHYSQNACATSQFENHIRGVLGMPLGSTQVAPFFSMINLIGPPGVQTTDDLLPKPCVTDLVHLHWYGKESIKPGRKLGHLNGVTFKKAEKNKMLNQLKKCHGKWHSACIKEAHK